MKRIYKLISLRSSAAIRAVSLYTFSNFFSKGISFLLLFVYTNPKYITPEENGLLNLFSNSLLFLMPFLSMGIVFSTSTDFFKLDKKSFRDFFTTGFVMPVLVMFISMFALFLFRDQLKIAYGFPYSFVWIIPLITFFTFCHEQLLAVSRSNNEPGVHLKTNVGKALIEITFSLVLVVFFAWRWQGRVAGILIAYSMVAIYGFRYFIKRDYLFGTIKLQYLKNEMVYAIPIIALQASVFCMSSSDKFFISHFTSDKNSTVGIYGIAGVFASIIFMIANASLQYFFPKIYSILASEEKDYAEIRKLFSYYTRLMLAGLAAVIIFIYIVYSYFLNEKYVGALSYIYIICAGNFIWCLTYFFYSFLLYNKQKTKLLVLSATSIIISLSLNYFFISRWSAFGAAIATVITYAIVFLLTIFITSRDLRLLFKRRGNQAIQ